MDGRCSEPRTLFSKYEQHIAYFTKPYGTIRYNTNYTSSLHEPLLCKSGPDFRKISKSKFRSKTIEIIRVDGGLQLTMN